MIIFAIVLGFIPGLVWLAFYLKEDLHPEPKRLLLYTFLSGASFSIFALALQLGLDFFFPNLQITKPTPPFTSLILLAAIEESIKFAAAFMAIHKNPEFDEPVDAMIYMVVAALGFATVENIGVLQGITSRLIFFGDVFQTLSLRFAGATLLHTLSSALVGYFWAISIRDFNSYRFVAWGLALATTLHTFFNYFIILNRGFVYPIILLLTAGFFIISDFESLNKKSI